jgi:DNA repair protein RadD
VISLYPDQVEAMRKLGAAMKSGSTRLVLKLPTGGGKTAMAADLARISLQRGKRMCFVVDAISLIDQTVERFAQFGIHSVGVIQASHPGTDYSKPIQVASVQTLARRDVLKYQHFDIVVVDEAHCQYSFINEWMAAWGQIPFVGLTATPYAKGMAKHWDTLVVGGTIRELIAAGRLSPYRIYAASHPDLRGVRSRAGDYVESELSERMQAGALVSDCVTHWQKHGEDRPTLAFCVDRTHAKHVQQQFESRGIRCGYVDAYTDREERQEIADAFHRGDLRVVASVGCLTKGVDWDVRCILLLRPTKSEMLYLQIVGRGLRVADGKDDCLILDHSDTAMRLGFPEEVDERNTELDDGERGTRADRDEDEPQPKPCPSCSFLKPPKTHQCPACGFAPTPVHEGDEVESELEELVPASKRKINRDTTPEQKGLFMAGLKQVAIDRGYKPGWAANQYREKFGVWPNKYRHVEPQAPNDMVKGWIKSRAIAWRKKQERAA